MLRIAICDDETDARDALRFQLEKILIEDAEEIVYEFSSGTNAASWLKPIRARSTFSFWTWK